MGSIETDPNITRNKPIGHEYLDVTLPSNEQNLLKELHLKRRLGVLSTFGTLERTIILVPHAHGRVLQYDPNEIIREHLQLGSDADVVHAAKGYLLKNIPLNFESSGINDQSIISFAAKRILSTTDFPVWQISDQFHGLKDVGKALIDRTGSGRFTNRRVEGKGDSNSAALAVTIAAELAHTIGMPGFVMPTLSNSPAETNAATPLKEESLLKLANLPEEILWRLSQINFDDPGIKINELRKLLNIRLYDDRYSQNSTVLLGLYMLQNYRYELSQIAKSKETPLILNIHTMYDRGDLEIVIGSRHGIGLENPSIELLLSLFLAGQFKVNLSSLTPLPAKTITYTEEEINQLLTDRRIKERPVSNTVEVEKQPGEDEITAYAIYQKWLTDYGLDVNNLSRFFSSYPDLKTGMLRGTDILNKMRDILGGKLNMIQIEIAQSRLANKEWRQKLNLSISRFISAFEKNELANLDYPITIPESIFNAVSTNFSS